MQNILAVYGSAYGQTARIMQRTAERLTELGFNVTVRKGDALAPNQPLDEYAGFLVGASIIGGKHQRYVENFVRRNRERLNRVPSAFISVSGTAASTIPAKRADAQRLLDKFLTDTGWGPARTATFAGAMAYTKYGFFTKWILQQIARRQGGPTDTSRDHEFTDWEAVDRFAQELAEIFQPAQAKIVGGEYAGR
jgi:menaquinone-dependent protoporphyrinogen oxidase